MLDFFQLFFSIFLPFFPFTVFILLSFSVTFFCSLHCFALFRFLFLHCNTETWRVVTWYAERWSFSKGNYDNQLHPLKQEFLSLPNDFEKSIPLSLGLTSQISVSTTISWLWLLHASFDSQIIKPRDTTQLALGKFSTRDFKFCCMFQIERTVHTYKGRFYRTLFVRKLSIHSPESLC